MSFARNAECSRGPLRALRQGAGLDVPGLPSAFAHEHGWRCGAMGDRGDLQALQIRKARWHGQVSQPAHAST